MSNSLDRFEPSSDAPVAIFVDSSMLYAYYYVGDSRHEVARDFFEAVRTNSLPYRPLFTNDYVLDEVVTRLRRHASHGVAAEAMTSIYESSVFRFEHVREDVLDTAVEQFQQYDDHGQLSFTDHVIAAHAEAEVVNRVATFDSDFEIFGLTTIPHYVE